MDKQRYYDRVAEELLGRSIRPGVWARAFSEAAGDSERARALYIRLRVEECAEEDRQAAAEKQRVVVEDNTPIVSSNGTTVESLGIETLGDYFTMLIPAGVPVPCSVSEIFSTAGDSQTSLEIHVLRGTKPLMLAKRNHSLGKFVIGGLPAEPKGSPKIEVTFSITERQIVLSIRDLVHGADLQIRRLERKPRP